MAKKPRRKINFFPQFFRKFTAVVLKTLKIAVLTLGLVFFLLDLHSLFFPQNEEYYKKKMAVLRSPKDPSLHAELAFFFLKNGGLKRGEDELSLASNLSSSNNLPLLKEAKDYLKSLKEAPKKIKEEVGFWEKIVEEKKDYRDAYLKLAVLNYQIGQEKQAKEYLEKALQLDPNFEQSKELEKLLSGE